MSDVQKVRQKKRLYLEKNFGPSNIFSTNAQIDTQQSRISKNNTSSVFDTYSQVPMQRKNSFYKFSHHNQSLIFTPVIKDTYNTNKFRLQDHNEEYLFGNPNQDNKPRRTSKQETFLKKTIYSRENENYGSFAKKSSISNVKKSVKEMFILQNHNSNSNDKVVKPIQEELTFAPGDFNWSTPHVGRVKTDVNENVNYDRRLYAKIRRFLEGSSAVIDQGKKSYDQEGFIKNISKVLFKKIDIKRPIEQLHKYQQKLRNARSLISVFIKLANDYF